MTFWQRNITITLDGSRFASLCSVRKRKSGDVVILYVKNYIKVFKNLKMYFFDKSAQKLDVFASRFDNILILQKIGQDRTKQTLVYN